MENCKITGTVLLDGENIYGNMDVTLLRKRVGMVFQKPNPFLMSIYDKVAFGPRTHGIRSKAKLDDIVERSLRGGHAVIPGIRNLLDEMLFNLGDNAVKYNVKGGSVEIDIVNEDCGTVLAVSDTGIGIPKEHQAHVFERFYRVDKSHSRETGGTGLGLSIVKHVAAVHGASVELDSSPGEGSKISIRFPG